MAFSHKLYNPTPWLVEIDWGRGVYITVPADGSALLTSLQMEQFMPGQPGSESIQETMDSFGVFLEDTDRDHDAQALAALERCLRQKVQRYESAVQVMQEMHTMQGIDPKEDSPAFQKKLASGGFVRLRDDIQHLKNRIAIYKKVVHEDDIEVQSPKFDPERTCFVLPEGPREFPTTLALEIFLRENPDIAEAHAKDVALRKAAESGQANEK